MVSFTKGWFCEGMVIWYWEVFRIHFKLASYVYLPRKFYHPRSESHRSYSQWTWGRMTCPILMGRHRMRFDHLSKISDLDRRIRFINAKPWLGARQQFYQTLQTRRAPTSNNSCRLGSHSSFHFWTRWRCPALWEYQGLRCSARWSWWGAWGCLLRDACWSSIFQWPAHPHKRLTHSLRRSTLPPLLSLVSSAP